LSYMGFEGYEATIERVVANAVEEHKCTRDVGGELGTEAAASWVIERVAAEL